MNGEPSLPEEVTQQQRCQDFLSGSGYWTTVYHESHEPENLGIFSALAPLDLIQSLLSEPNWNITAHDSLPAFWMDSEDRTHYARYGREHDLIPLVIVQRHHGVLPDMLPQILQEYCHYHDLWTCDGKNYKKLNRDGTTEDACEVQEHSVRIRAKHLKQFQAAKQLMLVKFIDSINDPANLWSNETLQAMNRSRKSDTYHLDLRVSPQTLDPNKVFSRLLGKAVTLPPPRSECGAWPWNEDQQETYQRFEIGETTSGKTITASCEPHNPAVLPSNAKAVLAADPYLTPVYFSLEVLDRYYNDPDKYSVEDGYLRCGSLWGTHVDNNHPDHVMVWLGDLGRDIPETERDHWVLHNIIAPAPSMSGTAFKRQIVGGFADADSPAWRFKSAYKRFRTCWKNHTGWHLLRDPDDDDPSLLPRLRIPSAGVDHAFEEQIRILDRLLVEALNAREIRGHLQSTPPGDARSLTLLQMWLEQTGYDAENRSDIFGYLHKVHTLRNKVASHRRSSNHEAALSAFGIAGDRRQAMSELLSEGEAVLNDLAEFVTTL